MHLSSITLKGFKSFPDRTRLTFSPGVSVIVGPNGSGKSNITDAVLWAMGEQSPVAVRGASMQDVIFAGAHGVQARSEAEVEVVLDNASGTLDLPVGEVAITRKPEPRGGGRVPHQRRQVPAHGRDRDPLGHRPGQGDALGRLAGARVGDRDLQAPRPADADRGGRRPRQAPQAPAPRATEARAHAGQPGPRAGRRARGAHAAEAFEAPGRGGRAARADRAPDGRGPLDPGPRRRPRRPRRAGRGRGGRGRGPGGGVGDGGRADRRRQAPRGRRGGAVLALLRARGAVVALLLGALRRGADRDAAGRGAARRGRARRTRGPPPLLDRAPGGRGRGGRRPTTAPSERIAALQAELAELAEDYKVRLERELAELEARREAATALVAERAAAGRCRVRAPVRGRGGRRNGPQGPPRARQGRRRRPPRVRPHRRRARQGQPVPPRQRRRPGRRQGPRRPARRRPGLRARADRGARPAHARRGRRRPGRRAPRCWQRRARTAPPR